jgi:hypothetical protein
MPRNVTFDGVTCMVRQSGDLSRTCVGEKKMIGTTFGSEYDDQRLICNDLHYVLWKYNMSALIILLAAPAFNRFGDTPPHTMGLWN